MILIGARLHLEQISLVKEHCRLIGLAPPLRNALPRQRGPMRDRTADLLNANQALSQLSYGPDSTWAGVDLNHRPHAYQACALTN